MSNGKLVEGTRESYRLTMDVSMYHPEARQAVKQELIESGTVKFSFGGGTMDALWTLQIYRYSEFHEKFASKFEGVKKNAY